MIIRVCGAIIRNKEILMVHHIHEGHDYWTLPGGGLEKEESPEKAIIREIKEETHLIIEVKDILFDEDYKENICRCFLLHLKDHKQIEQLGYDPEEMHKPKEQRMLKGLQWFKLDEMKEDKQVKKVIEKLKQIRERSKLSN